MNIQFIAMATLLLFMVPEAKAQSCTGCTNTLSGGGNSNITVNAGQTLCLVSGIFNPGSLTIGSGGTLCVGAGVTLNYGSWWTNNSNCQIINHGTINFTGSGGSVEGVNIENYDRFIFSGQMQNVSGTIINKGLFKVGNFISTSTTYIDNRDSFLSTGTTGLQGAMDNSGYAYLNNSNNTSSGISATINNYGLFVADGAIRIGKATYLINDSLVVFKSSVNFAGPMLTNSDGARMNVLGDFEVNSAQLQFVNSGFLYVSGAFIYNDAASGANNCRIFAKTGITLHAGDFINQGLLWSGSSLIINTGNLKNGATGFVRGINFTNHETASGIGAYYFTGTNINSGGIIAGDSASHKIQFYTTNGTPISNGTVTNVTFASTSSIAPLDTAGFDCSTTPELPPAGNPPYVKGDSVHLCSVAPVTFHLITDSLIQPYDNTYYIYWPALKLFDPANSGNPTNNTAGLTTPEGSFVADTTNQTIVFTPDPSFTSGTAKVQFRAADKTTGDPITYTSSKATLIINVTPVEAPSALDATGF